MVARAPVFLLLLALGGVIADVYLQNPRGSNDRLDDEGRERNNANRLFDSQNNNRGGYNVGNVYYVAGSKLEVQWTNQHSCGGTNANCEIIIQYKCDDKVRDGTEQLTIPANPNQCQNFNCDTDVRFGRQESFDSYTWCRMRSRNKGLFTANQLLNGNSAQYTRQNPNGDRRGLECPEERDYYPYWAPSEWKDLAIFTDTETRCKAYQMESQNVAAKYYCSPPKGWINARFNVNNWGQNGFIPITQSQCEAIMYQATPTSAVEYANWTKVEPFGIAAPACYAAPPSRDNHLGNGWTGDRAGHANGFTLTIPSEISETCVLRLRYNITTGDFNHWESATSVQSSAEATANTSFPTNEQNRNPALIDIWSKYKLTWNDVKDCFNKTINNAESTRRYCREYVLQNNPKVDIFGSLLPAGQGKIKLQLAVNTAQYGRTFQDRSHVYAVRTRSAANAAADGDILNINVNGKRGNIVQTYPATEYDFQPNTAYVKVGDSVHFQWTGSNTNPNNNAGQGRAGSDRSNIVMSRNANYQEWQLQTIDGQTVYGQWGTMYPQMLPRPGWANPINPDTQAFPNIAFMGFGYSDLMTLATTERWLDDNGKLSRGGNCYGGELSELDDCSPYFDLGPRKAETKGVFNYFSTRNNNFSNRNQQARVVVSETVRSEGTAATNAAMVWTPQGSLWVGEGTFDQVNVISLKTQPVGDVQNAGLKEVASHFLTVSPPTFMGWTGGEKVHLKLHYTENYLGFARLYRADQVEGPFHQYVADSWSTGSVSFSTTQGGVWVVRDPTNVAAVVIVTVLCVAVIAVGIYYARKYKKDKEATRGAMVQKHLQTTGVVTDLSLAKTEDVVGKARSPTTTTAARVKTSTAKKDLPSGWTEVQDPESGEVYYVNPIQGLTQWEFPTA